MRAPWLLLLLCRVAPGADVDEVVVSRDVFENRLKGRNLTNWADFVESAGEQGGEQRLQAGMSLALAIIATVAIGAFTVYLIGFTTQIGRQATHWLVFSIGVSYATVVFMYCLHASQDKTQRVVTNLLFGIVPLVISVASYHLVSIVFDPLDWLEKPSPEQLSRALVESKLLRFALCLAVLPSLAVCLYILIATSTTFRGGGTFFDILSFCLYSDVARFVVHLAFAVAPGWTLNSSCPVGTELLDGSESGRRAPSFKELPGAAYVVFVNCLVWYLILARLAAGGFHLPHHWTPSNAKIYVLACVNSYVFFPISSLLAWGHSERLSEHISGLLVWNLLMWLLAAWMLLVAIFFNAEGPNILGVACMLCLVFYNAKICSASLLGFVLVLALCAAVTFFIVFLSTHFAEPLRIALYAALK